MQSMDDLFPIRQGQYGLDLGDTCAPKSYEPDRQEVRQELNDILAAAKAALNHAPWDEPTFKYHKTVFPQMAKWLPDDEAAQLVMAFRQEIARIELLLAA